MHLQFSELGFASSKTKNFWKKFRTILVLVPVHNFAEVARIFLILPFLDFFGAAFLQYVSGTIDNSSSEVGNFINLIQELFLYFEVHAP